MSGNGASTPETEGVDSEGTNTTTTTGMWRPRFAPPYNPDDDPHQQPQQGTGPLADVSAAAASAGGGQATPTAVDSDEDMPLAPPETDPPPGATTEPGLQQQGTPYPPGDTDQTNPSSSSSEPTQVLNITMSAGIPPNRTGETYIQNRLSRNRQHLQQEQGNPATSSALPRSGVKAPPQAPGRLSPARYKAPPTQALASTAAAEPPVKQPPAQPVKPVAQGLQKPPGDHQTRKAPQPKPPPAHLVHEETPQPRRPAAAAGSQPQDQPQEEPPKPRQPPPADFRHSQPTALYRQVFGHGRDPPATPAGSTAIAEHPVQEDDLEHEEPPETAAAAAAAAESPSHTTDDVWEKLRASLQHLDADPIVGTRHEPEPSFAPGQQHSSRSRTRRKPHISRKYGHPQQKSKQQPQRQLAGPEVPAPKGEGLRTHHSKLTASPLWSHGAGKGDRGSSPHGRSPRGNTISTTEQTRQEGTSRHKRPNRASPRQRARTTKHRPTPHSTSTSTSSSSKSRRRPRPQPPQRRPEPAHNKTTRTMATQQRGRLPRTTNSSEHGEPPLTQHTRKLSTPHSRGHKHKTQASSRRTLHPSKRPGHSSRQRSGCSSQAQQQWQRGQDPNQANQPATVRSGRGGRSHAGGARREDTPRSPACWARPLSLSCLSPSLLRSVGWPGWLLPLLCPFLGSGAFLGGGVLIWWFSRSDGGVPVPTRKPCTCHLTTLKSPGLTMALRPLFHPRSHSRPARRCCASTAAAEDGISGSCRPHPTRSPFWPKASTHRCSMRRGQRDTSNGSPWARHP